MEEYYYFVAHEFGKQEKDDLRRAIEEAFEGTGLEAYYANSEIRSGTSILEKIKERIFGLQFGIYDITTKRPNVFIELGLAIAAKNPFHIICKKGTKIPADLAGLDRIEYETYKELTELLKDKIVKGELAKLKQRRTRELQEDKILQKCIKLYQAEELFHRWGKEVEDSDARNKKAWSVILPMPLSLKEYGLDTHIVYGPYERLPEPGLYKAIFKIKVDDNSDKYPIFRLEINSDSNPSMVKKYSKDIKGTDFTYPRCYQLFELEFEYSNEPDMQYRVRILKEKQIWIDYIAIIKLRDRHNKWSEDRNGYGEGMN